MTIDHIVTAFGLSLPNVHKTQVLLITDYYRTDGRMEVILETYRGPVAGSLHSLDAQEMLFTTIEPNSGEDACDEFIMQELSDLCLDVMVL